MQVKAQTKPNADQSRAQTAQDPLDSAPATQQGSTSEVAMGNAGQAWPLLSEDLSKEVFSHPNGSSGPESQAAGPSKLAVVTERSPSASEAGPSKELPDLEDPATIRKMHAKAVAGAEALVDLVDQLSGAPLTPQTEQAWLRVLKNDLEPGPFARYVVEKMGTVATMDGPVREELLKIATAWQKEYGGKVVYKADLNGLENTLWPKQGLGITERLMSLFRRSNPSS